MQPYTGKYGWSVEQGTTQQFTADVGSVTWSIVGGPVKEETSISSDGFLTVATDETATFAICATSTANSALKGTVSITVKAATVVVDKGDLKALVNKVADLNEEEYTEESYTLIKEAYDAAVLVLENDSVTQEQVDSALEKLTTAIEGLEQASAVYKGDLSDTYDLYKDLEKGNYNDESWNALQDALSDVNEVLGDDSATQEKVDTALDALEMAYGNLKEWDYLINRLSKYRRHHNS